MKTLNGVVVSVLLGACALSPALAADPTATPSPTAKTLIPTDGGRGVLDPLTRTVWSRCVEGMEWNVSTCTGRPLLLTRAEATARAKERSTTEAPHKWRLPRTRELRGLVDKQTKPPSVDVKLFPENPGGLHWSGSANVRQLSVNPYNYGNVASGRTSGGSRLAALKGWAVDMDSGEANSNVARASKLHVRLVRSAD